MMRAMTVERITISLDADLAELVKAAADEDSLNVSAWFGDAARQRLASRRLRTVIDDWEQEHGAFSEDELAAAAQRIRR